MDKNTPLYTGILQNSPLGDLWVAVTDQGLGAIEWSQDEAEFGAYLTKRFKRPVQPNLEKVTSSLRQLDEYLRGARKAFDLQVDWSLLRPFQRKVLQIVFAIPYGQTRTYIPVRLDPRGRSPRHRREYLGRRACAGRCDRTGHGVGQSRDHGLYGGMDETGRHRVEQGDLRRRSFFIRTGG